MGDSDVLVNEELVEDIIESDVVDEVIGVSIRTEDVVTDDDDGKLELPKTGQVRISAQRVGTQPTKSEYTHFV